MIQEAITNVLPRATQSAALFFTQWKAPWQTGVSRSEPAAVPVRGFHVAKNELGEKLARDRQNKDTGLKTKKHSCSHEGLD